MSSMTLSYQHRVVRDLAWLMLSPGLLQVAPQGQRLVTDNWCQKLYAEHKSHLRKLDKNPQPLLRALSKCKSHRLGVYFEFLLRYWLEDILCVQKFQHNVPIFQPQATGGKRTLGEFDFLFQMPKKNPLHHWEATVKFYLQKTDDEGKSFWIGPGDNDRLDIKLNRLFQHQLKLTELPEAEECLQHWGAESIQPAAFIKGYLFYPLNKAGAFPALANNDANFSAYTLSPNHNKGWWLHWKSMSLPVTAHRSRWVILCKSRWLSPAHFMHTDASLMNVIKLEAYCENYFQDQSRPLLVAELDWHADAWQEVSRGFVLAPQ